MNASANDLLRKGEKKKKEREVFRMASINSKDLCPVKQV